MLVPHVLSFALKFACSAFSNLDVASSIAGEALGTLLLDELKSSTGARLSLMLMWFQT